jgi:hypothetical protein
MKTNGLLAAITLTTLLATCSQPPGSLSPRATESLLDSRQVPAKGLTDQEQVTLRRSLTPAMA